jgi:hypothetical protein
MEENATLGVVIKEDILLALNPKVEVMGAAEFKEVCGGSPNRGRQQEGGSNSGMAKTMTRKRRSYPLFDSMLTASTMVDTQGMDPTGRRQGRSSMNAKLISA